MAQSASRDFLPIFRELKHFTGNKEEKALSLPPVFSKFILQLLPLAKGDREGFKVNLEKLLNKDLRV